MAGFLPVLYTVVLLAGSCTVMVVAWYLHLKHEEWPLWKAILFSWLIAGAEYCLQVPGNRIGHADAGMPAAHLRAIAELFILVAFLAFSQFILCEPVRWNHVVGFLLVLLGVGCVLMGPFDAVVYQGCAANNTNNNNTNRTQGHRTSAFRDIPMHRLHDTHDPRDPV
ncbi:hypothetical protein T484DRAFT_1634047 [Baffinella frigidus]|nr:hypothetical protein T484DRAFT_1634047 [Cryptophyta sp. CCMP2293]